MEFVCKIGTDGGKVLVQTEQAGSETELRHRLKTEGFYVFSIRSKEILSARWGRGGSRIKPDDFLVYSGDDFVTLPMLALGSRGVISVISNVEGRKVQEMVSAFHAKDTAHAAALHHELFPLCEVCFLESGNPACAKRALEICGFPVGGVRLPLAEASAKDTERIRAVCERMGLIGT